MLTFTADQQTRMKATIAKTFVDTVIIYRTANTRDAEGNSTDALTTIATTVGRWAPLVLRSSPVRLGSSGLDISGQPAELVDALLTVAPGTNIETGDLVDVHGARWIVGRADDERLQKRVGLRRVAA